MITLFALCFIAFWGLIAVFAIATAIVGGIIGAILGVLKVYRPDIESQKKQLNEYKYRGFTDTEILGTGLYPKDDGYKMSLISRILDKK